jgi:hypothetical protein
MAAAKQEQTHTPRLQDPQLASLQRGAQAPRGSLTIWFDPALTWDAAPTGKRGRQPDDSDAAIQTCPTVKVLFGMALRQTTVRRWPHRREPAASNRPRLEGA